MTDRLQTIWLLHNNAAGNARQCINLADAVLALKPGLKIVHKPFRLRRPYIWLPPELTPRHTAIATPDWSRHTGSGSVGSGSVGGAFPDLLIACGRQSAPIAFAIRAQSGGRTRHVQILDPGSVRDRIDLLVVPEHDQVKGTDVMTTLGSLTPVLPGPVLSDGSFGGAGSSGGGGTPGGTSGGASGGKSQNSARFAAYPRPLYCALIGGSDRRHRYKRREMRALFGQLKTVADAGYGLAVTTSGRTDAALAGLLSGFQSYDNVAFWHAAPPGTRLDAIADDLRNPYAAMLNEADLFLVTPDSVNMVCEAAGTGKGIMLLGDPANLVAKKKSLHKALVERGYVRPFDLNQKPWRVPPLQETARVAAEIIRRFA